ncbi:zinc finger protein 493-like [Neocloeon triangulifer]|uniref:zinc finger protein 493-like n=1 Tax=Neocloeon triangulifer TaxID=2078957 RepID=UPI00286FA084|nr:zinc finger protein 493-like [Neocloeon triangulifer]
MAVSTKVGDMCRLCGTDTLNIVRHAIFEGEGLTKKYALKISECLPLQVTVEDPLPKNMCGECAYKLDLMSDFRDKAVKTEVMLVSLVEGVKPEIPDDDDGIDHEIDNDDDFRSDTPVEQIEQQTEPEIQIKEEEAPPQPEKRPSRRAAAKRPIRESDGEDDEIEEEPPAKKRGRKSKEIAPAATTAPAPTPAASSAPKENTGKWSDSDQDQWRCLLCNHDYGHRFMRHMKSRHPQQQRLQCSWCLRFFFFKEVLEAHIQRHLATVDWEGYKYKCEICSGSYYTLGLYTTHMRKQHNIFFEIQCEFCDKKFHQPSLYEKHVRSHKPKLKPLECDQCVMKFSTVPTLVRHRILKHDILPYDCEICDQKFRMLRDLHIHVLTHAESDANDGKPNESDGKQNKDDVAKPKDDGKPKKRIAKPKEGVGKPKEKPKGTDGKQKGNVKKPNKNDKNTPKKNDGKCERLELIFEGDATLISLMLVQCGTCLKTFSQIEGFESHVKGHNRKSTFPPPAYICATQGCATTFNKIESLCSHLMSAHAVDFFFCKLCNERFQSESRLHKHELEAHFMKCVQCNQNFHSPAEFSEHNLENHLLYDDNCLPFCNLCTKVFKNAPDFMKHFQFEAHGNPRQVERKHQCPYCDYETMKTGILREHLKVCQKRKLKIEECRKNLTFKQTLEGSQAIAVISETMSLADPETEKVQEKSIEIPMIPICIEVEKVKNKNEKIKNERPKLRKLLPKLPPTKTVTVKSVTQEQQPQMKKKEKDEEIKKKSKPVVREKRKTATQPPLKYRDEVEAVEGETSDNSDAGPEVQYTCEICYLSFTRSSDLKRHIWVRHSMASYKCQKCQMAFGTSKDAKKHEQEAICGQFVLL